MRNISLVILFFLSYSCTSMSQERRDSVINTSDSISCQKDSIITSRLTLLFAGDLMQHQAQINAAVPLQDTIIQIVLNSLRKK